MASISTIKTVKILIFGGGSLGALFSHLLSTSTFANIQVTIVCRGNYNVVATSGYTITTKVWGNHTHRPHRVVLAPLDIASEIYDYVIVTTKAIPQIGGAKPALAQFPIGGDVPIILIQNGIGIEEPYRAAFPTNPIFSGVAYIAASQPSPGHILQINATAKLILGFFDRQNPADQKKLEYVAEILGKSGFPTYVEDEIQKERWRKLGWNGSWNVLCAATGLETQEYLKSSAEAVELVREMIREIAKTANACGVAIDGEELAEMHIQWAYNTLSVAPSMLQDARNGVEMELEVLCGNVWRMAEGVGLKTPRLKSLYTILAAMNWRFRNARNVSNDAQSAFNIQTHGTTPAGAA